MLAVKFLHDQDILHRDLKFENVLMMIDGTVKLADFGLTKELRPMDSNSYTTAAVGTKKYMAPEVFEEKRYA